MARYQIILAYDGSGFYGSQRQGQRRTVQGEIEKTLVRIGWTGRSVLMAGRTDTGVHASAQVAAFDLEWGHGLGALQRALNSNLPVDIAVRGVKQVHPRFHPRFDARSRRYCYRLFCQPVREPLRERYAWRVWPPVANLEPLSSIWPGVHDFSAFGSPTTPRGSTVRLVKSTGWRQAEDEWFFEIEADAFLYRMVRRLVYVQVAVGQGRACADDLKRALQDSLEEKAAAQKRIPAGLALPNGLTLVEVKYDDLEEIV